MAFLILLFLVLAAQPLPWPESPLGWGHRGSLLATAIAAAVPVAVAWWLARRTRRRLLTAPADRERTLRSYGRGRLLHLVALVGVQFAALGLLGWGWAVRTACGADRPEDLPFGGELLLIAPFLAGLVLSWARFYSAEQAISGSADPARGGPAFGGRWGYVLFLTRQYLAVVGVPLGLMVAVRGLQRLDVGRFDGAWFLLAPVGLVGAALVLAPWPLRVLLGARPLPAGPIRHRLEAAAKRLRFRYSDILLWDTRGGVANAMVAGPLPWLRYVFLSDRLIADLTPAEVEAVFGHEVGHVRHGHLPFYAAFMGLSVAALIGVWVLLLQWLAPGADPAAAESGWQRWEAIPQMVLVGVYVFIVFGYLSRRCERQADVYGCRAVSCGSGGCAGHAEDAALPAAGTGLCPTGIRTFIAALDKVADVNGISRRRPGWLNAWLHGTIAQRVAFLEGVIGDRQAERRFQRRLGLLKWGLLAGLTLGLVVLVAGHWEEIRPLVWPA